MEQRVSLVTLWVVDLERAARFYEGGLGWKRWPGPTGVVFFQGAGSVIALWSREELAADAALPSAGSGFRGIALAHNARSRDEVDAVLGEADAAGAVIVKAATETFWGGYSGYFTDPDGHLWEVAYNPFWTIDASGAVTMASA